MSAWGRFRAFTNGCYVGMSAMGRFLPVGILSPDRPLLGGSGHSKMV